MVLTICVAIALYLLFGRNQPDKTRSSDTAKPIASAAPATEPAAVTPPSPAATPAPEAKPEPAVSSQPKPQAQAQENVPDIATIARTPALWPKSISLTQALTIPVVVNGKVAGQAQVPAQTTVRLVRVAGTQLEVEHLNQRLTIPFTTTDIVARATALARTLSATTAASTAAAPQTLPAAQPPASRVPAAPAAQPSSQQVNAKEPGHYRKLALEVMEDIQKKFWIRESERYAKKAGSNEPDTVWGAGVMFSALVGAARHDSGHYEPVLRKFFDGLNGYWDTKAKIPGYEPAPTAGNGHDKYYDDNAWMVITFFEAYELTHNPRFRRRAEETLDFVLSGWDETVLNGGIWWHEAREKKSQGKNTCANAPSAVACLLSAKYSQPQSAKQRTEMAQKIVQWTVSNLQHKDSLFADSIGINGEQNRARLTYNSALMLRAFLGLHRATKKPEYLAEAQRIGHAADSFLSQETGAYRDPVKWAHLMVEADLELYRTTHEDYLLTRATKNADFYYETWKSNPPSDLISIASIARTLWLMADAESEVGRKFWEAADSGKSR